MRTTLTLDDDVAAGIEHLRSQREASLKSIVNEALRLGLRLMEDEGGQAGLTEYTQPRSLGRLIIGSVDNVEEALSIAESDMRK